MTPSLAREALFLVTLSSIIHYKYHTRFSNDMTAYNLSGVVGLKEDEKEYALMLGDTVVIGDSGATVLTPSKKKIRSVSIFLKVSCTISTDSSFSLFV